MNNRIYFSFSGEGSTPDAWIADFMNYFRITLEKVTPRAFGISTGPDNSNLREADLVILVFNGFISDSFAGDLKIIESDEWKNEGKELFVVVKSGRFSAIVPGYLRKYNRYNFYDINSRTNEIVDFLPFIKGEKENRFWSGLTDLAFDVKLFFENLNTASDAEKLTLYLAEVSRDQAVHREILKREFLLSGIRVVPLKPLPGTFREYHDTVKEIIGTADVSVHVMGEIYGDSPAGTDYSFPEIQNKIITELSGQSGRDSIYRFVWLPPNLEPYDEKQIQYLKRLRKELNESGRGEIIQCSLEEFKEIVFQKLKNISGSSAHSVFGGNQGKVVLITDDSLRNVFQKVDSLIKIVRNDYELIDMSQAGDLFPPFVFRNKLHAADRAIILNASGNLNWIKSVLGLTMKNIFTGKDTGSKSIAAVTSYKNKEAIDFEALNIDFFSLEDSQLTEHIENFLIQKI